MKGAGEGLVHFKSAMVSESTMEKWVPVYKKIAEDPPRFS